jgi:uncharacterized protein (DUF58 family)
MTLLSVSTAALFLALGCAIPAAATTAVLPAGTRVTVSLASEISSGDAAAGQHFTFEASAPVRVANRVLIAKGASGSGRVVKVTKAHGKSAGAITLQFVNIHAVNGKPVSLTETSSSLGSAEKGKASTATIAATIALGPLGLFAHNMVKGKDVVIKPDQTFPAWVKSNTPINVT